MPLQVGTSTKVIGENISELHGGKTFSRTKKKFGKKRANAQAVAIALSESRRSKDAVSATASPYSLHGPGSLLGVLGLGAKKKVKVKSPFANMFPNVFSRKKEKELRVGRAELRLKEYGLEYASIETWDLCGVFDALSDISRLIGAEADQDEPKDMLELIDAADILMEFATGEFDEIRDAIKSVKGQGKEFKSEKGGGADKATESLSKSKDAALTITKDANGKYRWTMITSSSFEDKDGEILSQLAQVKDVERMNKTKEYGYLGWRHLGEQTCDNPQPTLPLIVLGNCDFSAMHDAVRIESGGFVNEHIGEKLSIAKELSGSLSFYGDPDTKGVYHDIFTKGRTVTWKGAASNPLADFSVQKENDMENTKLKELEALIGKDAVESLLAQATQKQKDALALGLRQKEAVSHKHGDKSHSHNIAEGESEAKHEHTAAEVESLKGQEEEAGEKGKEKKKKVPAEKDEPKAEEDGETAEEEKAEKGKELVLKEMLAEVVKQTIKDNDTARAKETDALKVQIKELADNFAAVTKQVQKLSGNLPSSVKSHRPSEDNDSDIDTFIESLKTGNSKESDPANTGLIDKLFPELSGNGRKPIM